MCKKRFIGGIALIAVAASGCGVATASPSVEEPIPSEPTLINYVDPSQVHGLSARTLSGGDSDERHVHAVYPSVADAPRLTEKLRRTVTARLDRFTAGNAVTAARPHPEFNVSWQLAAVSDQVLGVRLRIGESPGSGWTNSQTTVWYDRENQRVVDSADLLKDPVALTALATLVRDRLALRGAGVNPGSVRPDAKMFDSIGFNPRGDLVVEFDDHQVARGSIGRVAVAIPCVEASALLSAIGLWAQRAATGVGIPASVPSEESIDAASTAKPPARSSKAGGVDCAKVKCVALTYDDGPGPETGRLLDTLTEYGARATFFSVGSNASAHPELLRRMKNEGHLVANHSWSHRDLTSLSSIKVSDQLVRAQHAIAQSIDQAPTLMRPPYGLTDPQIASVAGRLGLAVVRWNVDTGDRRDPDPRAIADRAVAGAKPGAIVLMHDVHRATVDAAPEILRRLAAEGYTFVTVPELFGSREMQPGKTYDSGSWPSLEKQSMS